MPSVNASCEVCVRNAWITLLILQERQLQRVLNAYVTYFNQARPHQGIGQQIPEPSRSALSSQDAGGKVIAIPVMDGLHHDYQ
jgi:putative transposase